jgi:cysteine desulfurase / selenocysteine lyase
MGEPFDFSTLRREFPVLQRMLYFDAAHQTPLASSVRAALDRFQAEAHEYGGPKSVWLKRVEEVRARVAKLIGADASEIAFTKNTSEGLNIAANSIPFAPGDNVLMVEGDHPNNAYAFLNLRRKSVAVRFVALEGETATADTFARHIDERTRAISLSHVTFHAGHRFDIEGIGKLARSKGVYFVVDATQSIGVIPLDARTSEASIIACSCHKGLYVPQGLGILYVRKDLQELQPAYLAMAGLANPPADLIARPNNLQLRADAGRFEIGNFSLANIHGLAASLTLIESSGVGAINRHVLDLGDHLIRGLDRVGIGLVGPRVRSHRSHIYVLDVPTDEWLQYFADNNVRASPERDGVRISFGLFNSVEDVARLMDLITRKTQV